jgi:hypothetical protein
MTYNAHMRSLTVVAWCGFITAVLPFLAIPSAYKLPVYVALGAVASVLSIVTRLRYLHFMEEHEAMRSELSVQSGYPLEYPAEPLTEESNA